MRIMLTFLASFVSYAQVKTSEDSIMISEIGSIKCIIEKNWMSAIYVL